MISAALERQICMWESEYVDTHCYPDFDQDKLNKHIAQLIKQYNADPTIINYDYYFITVNPKPETDLQVFLKLLVNFTKRKPVGNFFYSIEQRGETEIDCGKGFHAHILLSWDSKMSKKVRQYSGETFKRCIGMNNNNIININKIPKDYWNDKLEYLNGSKWDSEKESKIKMDLIFRQKNNILSLYKKDGDL